MRLAVLATPLLLVVAGAVRAEDAPRPWAELYSSLLVGRAKEALPSLRGVKADAIAGDVDGSAALLLAAAHTVALNVAEDPEQLEVIVPFLSMVVTRVRALHGKEGAAGLAIALEPVVRLRLRSETTRQVVDAEWTAAADALRAVAEKDPRMVLARLVASDLLTELAWNSASARSAALEQADKLLVEADAAYGLALGRYVWNCRQLRRARIAVKTKPPDWASTLTQSLKAAKDALVHDPPKNDIDSALVQLVNLTITDLRLAGGTTDVEYEGQRVRSRGVFEYELPFYAGWHESDFAWPAEQLAGKRRVRPEGTTTMRAWYSGAGEGQSKKELQDLVRSRAERELQNVLQKSSVPTFSVKTRSLNLRVGDAQAADVKVKADGQPVRVRVWAWRGAAQANNFTVVVTTRGEALLDDPEVEFFLRKVEDVR